MSKIIKPASRATIEFNQQTLQSWGTQICDQNQRVVILIAVDERDTISFKAIDGIPPRTLETILNLTAKEVAKHIPAGIIKN